MSFYEDNQLSYVHVEATTRCNAACPMCLRNRGGDILNPELKYDNFNIDWFDRFDLPINGLTLCGNYGDPIVHPNLHNLIEKWLEKFDKPITMMTNGGARTSDWWERLANVSKGKLTVIFGIDGLEDTNHLYRRNVDWQRLMVNSRAYIDAGGRAGWKFITFKHNQHQVDKAREMSQSIGFAFFEQIITNRFRQEKFNVVDTNGNVLYHLEQPDIDESKFKAKNPNRISKDREWTGSISCYAKKENSVYISADGRVYPCCNLGYHFNHDLFEPYAAFASIYDMEEPKNINNMSLSDIVSGKFFREVKDKWSEIPLARCIRTCGVFRDNLSKKWE